MSDFLTNPAPPPEFPYLVAPGLYPIPSNVTPGGGPSLVQLVATPTGTDYLLYANHSSTQLWLSPGAYDPNDARALFSHQACLSGSGSTCVATRSVYLTWGQPVRVYSTSGTIVANALASVGSALVIGVTVGASTSILETANGGGTLSTLGTVSGALTSLAANPESVLATTVSSGSLSAVTLSMSGGIVNTVAVGPSGGIRNASAAWVPTSTGVENEAIVASDPATGSVLAYTSSNAGHSFSAGTRVGLLNQTSPSAILDQIGETRLVPPGGIVGQVTSTSVGNGLFVLYTNRTSDGRVVPEAEVSPDGGTHWEGPYVVATPAGSVQDPTVTADPDGDVVATWRDSGNGSWQVDQAVFSPNGTLRAAPAALPDSGGNAPSGFSAGPPVLAVDWLGRPIYAWAAPGPQGFQIDYSGAFLSALNSVTVLRNLVNDPLEPADFAPETTTTQTKFVSNTDSNLSLISSSISDGALSTAQNDTTQSVIPALTHLSLVVTDGLKQPPASTSTLTDTIGTFSPNVYLAVYAAQLVNALGGGIAASPLQSANAFGIFGGPQPPPTFSGSVESDGATAYVAVTATPQSPDAVLLSPRENFPGWSSPPASGPCHYPNGTFGRFVVENYSIPVNWWSNVSLPGAASGKFSSSSSLPSVYLTNLTANTNVSWSGTFAATYEQFYHRAGCGMNITNQIIPDTLGPLSITIPVSGYAITSLGIVPNQPYLLNGVWTSNSAPPVKLTAEWNNSMLAEDSIWLNYIAGGNAVHWPNATSPSLGYVIYQALNFYGLSNSTYSAQIDAQSQLGVYTSSERPALSFGNPNSYPAQHATYNCNFNLAPPTFQVWWNVGSRITNLTTSSAQVKWSASADGLGSVTYYEYGTGVNFTVSNVPAIHNTSHNSTTWDYTVVLRNLDPFALYWVSVGVGVGSGCLQKTLVKSFDFLTPGVLTLYEADHPYDSITETGGGATISWMVPLTFARTAGFRNGVLFWSNGTTTVQLPLTSTSQFQRYPNVGLVNLPPLPKLNTTYQSWVDLNYTFGGTALNVTSVPVFFDYLCDTSGDGLADLEKGLGWPNPTAPGLFVTANPSVYATNGLVNDYVEKVFGLNPRTIDTASSHMLDTWNLTFQLSSSTCPADIQCWYENGSNPFSYNVTPTGPNPGGAPVVTNSTNFAHWTRGGLQDDAPYDAEVLWTGGALGVLQGLITSENVGWLRGVVMHSYNGEWTLTVWGKLSWGANPLVASTPNDGKVDGARINPLSTMALELSQAYGTGENLPAPGTGYALYFTLRNGTATSGIAELSNYSSPALYEGTPAAVSDYNVTFPVSQTSQFQTLQLQLVENKSGTTLVAVPLNGTQLEVNITYNMVTGGHKQLTPLLGTANTNGYAEFDGYLQAVGVGEKTPTDLWLPDGNSTVNGLPVGLERYTGEQSFDLVVVNASASLTSNVIPLPWGGYTRVGISLSPGLNNFLLPREQFLASPIGEAVLLGKLTAYAKGSTTPQLLTDSGVSSLLTGFGGANLSVDLSAYWQNRSITSGGTIPGTVEKGTGASSRLQLAVMAVESTLANNTGGLPSNPSLYNSTTVPPALQTIVTLNVTSTAMLDVLLAGFLDNTTGGVNGTFQSVTNQVGFLGLAPSVVSALANAAVAGDGLYGPPASNLPKPQPSGFWGNFWNAVTSVITNPLGTILSLVAVVWNAATAAFTYFNHLAHEAATVGGTILARTVTMLMNAGKVIVSALNMFIQWIINHVIDPALNAIIGPIEAGVSTYDNSLNGPLKQAWASENSSGSVGQANAISFANAFVDGAPFEIALGIGVAVTIVLSLLTPFDLGPSFVVGIVIGLIAGATLASFGSLSAAASLSSSAVVAIQNVVNPIKSFPSTEWGTLAGVFGLLTAGAEVPWSWYLLTQAVLAKPSFSGYMSAMAVMALALTALVIGVIAVASASAILLLLAFVVSCIALFGVTTNFFTSELASIPSVKLLGEVDVGLSASAMFGSALDLYVNIPKLEKAL